MPFKSEAQRRFLWSQHPEVAESWAHEYPGQHDLPYHVKGHRGRRSGRRKKAANVRGILAQIVKQADPKTSDRRHNDYEDAPVRTVKRRPADREARVRASFDFLSPLPSDMRACLSRPAVLAKRAAYLAFKSAAFPVQQPPPASLPPPAPNSAAGIAPPPPQTLPAPQQGPQPQQGPPQPSQTTSGGPLWHPSIADAISPPGQSSMRHAGLDQAMGVPPAPPPPPPPGSGMYPPTKVARTGPSGFQTSDGAAYDAVGSLAKQAGDCLIRRRSDQA